MGDKKEKGRRVEIWRGDRKGGERKRMRKKAGERQKDGREGEWRRRKGGRSHVLTQEWKVQTTKHTQRH